MGVSSVETIMSDSVGHSNRQILSPNLLGDFNLQSNFRPLLLLSKVITLHSRAEATLMRQAELIKPARAERSGFFQPLDDLFLVIKLSLLATHYAEHHNLVLRQEAQRLEPARPGIVVLEEININIELTEERLGDRLVAALGKPLRPEVATAQVDADDEVLRPLADGPVDQRGVLFGEFLGVFAVTLGGLRPHALIAEVGQIGVVKLHEPAAGGIQVVQLGLVGSHEVVEEGVQRGVCLGGDGLPSAAEVHHRRRRDAYLGRDLGGYIGRELLADRFDEFVVVDLDWGRVADLARDDQLRRSNSVGRHIRRLHAAPVLNARQMLEEVNVEPPTTELAVGDGMKASSDLLLHDLSNVLILQLAQVSFGDWVGRLQGLPGSQDRLRAQETADVVGTIDTSGKRHIGVVRQWVRFRNGCWCEVRGLGACLSLKELLHKKGPGKLVDTKKKKRRCTERYDIRPGGSEKVCSFFAANFSML